MTLRRFVFDRLTGRLGDLLGRARLVRVGAYLGRAGRLDAPDELARNGEGLVQQTVARHAAGPTTVVDCGANTGRWSAALLSAFARAGNRAALRLYCFEPSAPAFEKLTANLAPRAVDGVSIHPVRQALSRRAGEATLYVVHEAAGTNSLTHGAAPHRATEVVEATTLSAFVRQRGIERIDFLKIDAEGHDFEVLAGARALIAAGVVDLIQFEYNQRWIYGGRFLRDVFLLLADTDYAIGKVTPRGIQWCGDYDCRLESFVQGNWLACGPRWVANFPTAPGWLSGAG